MSDSSTPAAAPAPQKSRRRVIEYFIVLLVIGAVVAGAFYMEQIRYFVTLKMWDKAAPEKALAAFLEAGQKGDRAAAQALVGVGNWQPLEEGGRWVGYTMTTQAGRLKYVLSDLVPAGGFKVTESEWVLVGEGAVLLTVPDSRGKGTVYRLEVKDGTWKVTEIRGGKPG
jgi:hypothetical protein